MRHTGIAARHVESLVKDDFNFRANVRLANVAALGLGPFALYVGTGLRDENTLVDCPGRRERYEPFAGSKVGW